MKTKSILISLLCAVMLTAGMQVSVAQDKTQKKKDSNKETVELLVEGMHCQNCQKKIEKNIAYEKGITDLEVDLENKTVKVSYKKNKTTLEKIQAAFKKLGYEAKIVEDDPES